MKFNHTELGIEGEKYACEQLISKGYTLLSRNYRWNRAEIDLVMKDKDRIVFIEVKTRNTAVFGKPYEAVTKSKQKQLIKAANAYIQEKEVQEEARFDVVSIVWNSHGISMEHLKDAFYPSL